MKKTLAVFSFSLLLAGCNSNEKKGESTGNALESEKVSENAVEQEGALGTEFDFLPKSTTGVVVKRDAFTFSYNEEYEQSEWVAYELEPEDFSNRDFQRPLFIEDPKVPTHSADWRNYKNSGYDKGHLCPAGDRKSSFNIYSETFFTSNVSPQLHDFNDGVWNRLEQKVRYWARKYNGVYVVTGGVLNENLKTIGKEHVAVPNYFYKVLLTKDRKRMLGFLVPHQDSNKALYEFATSVDAIEQMTGIDFYPELPDSLENQLEKNDDYKAWSF